VELTTLVAPAVLLVVGAAVGLLPTLLLERRKEKHALATRWDLPLFEISSRFTAAARSLLHCATETTPATPASIQEMGQLLAELRASSEQLRLVANAETQGAARLVVRHAYAVRQVAVGRVDKRASEYDSVSPAVRCTQALNVFYVAARKNLGVKNPLDVPEHEIPAPFSPAGQTILAAQPN